MHPDGSSAEHVLFLISALQMIPFGSDSSFGLYLTQPAISAQLVFKKSVIVYPSLFNCVSNSLFNKLYPDLSSDIAFKAVLFVAIFLYKSSTSTPSAVLYSISILYWFVKNL